MFYQKYEGGKLMEYICGMTFAPFAAEGRFSRDDAKKSLKKMRELTSANFVIFVPNGLQETPYSEEICYNSPATMNDGELREMIAYAQSLEMRVALKPTVNCKNGIWRAYVNFFDEEVPCEAKWSNWFASYEKFQLHYARIAEETGCEMLIAGCEMVMSERREQEWRNLIAAIRREFHGLVSYNTDKYQEHNVKWWDCVDVISSSGYYPIGDWENQLDRIEEVVKRFQKPFFFAEAGCMSVDGSMYVPNDWNVKGAPAPEQQAKWYETMMQACEKRSWINGMAFWSWTERLYSSKQADQRCDYEIYGKPAQEIVKKYYEKFQHI